MLMAPVLPLDMRLSSPLWLLKYLARYGLRDSLEASPLCLLQPPAIFRSHDQALSPEHDFLTSYHWLYVCTVYRTSAAADRGVWPHSTSSRLQRLPLHNAMLLLRTILRRTPRRAQLAAGCSAAAAATLTATAAGCLGTQDEYEKCFAPGTRCNPPLEYSQWESNWDGRAPPEEASESLKKRLRRAPKRHLILIRHGQYDLESDTDPPLTALGRHQATLTGQHIASWAEADLRTSPSAKPQRIKIGNIYSSNMLRARTTAELIAAELPDATLHAADSMLAEGAPYPVSGWRPYPATLFEEGARIEAAFRRYVHRSEDGWRAHKKETAAAQKAAKKGEDAAAAAVEERSYEDEDTYDLVVCHGNVIRYFVCRALQLPPERWLRLATYNCGMTHLAISASGGVSLWGFGDHAHLDIEHTTYH
jgi:serine/threonine-protein phosphatase PGAM5